MEGALLMPRFYFHVDDNRTTLDQEGTVLPDIEAARQESITAAGEMLRNGSGHVIWGGKPWRMRVTDQPDAKSKPLFTLRFSASES
jgi:hypothetical protein